MIIKKQAKLDELGPGAVVLDRFGHAWQQGGHYRFNSDHGYWYRAYGDSSMVSPQELIAFGPFRALHKGGKP